ncbi:MAG: hypothetical protein ACPGVH_04110 [Chitinophagales bacterium]
MKKSIKRLAEKKVINLKAIKGGTNGKGTKRATSSTSGRPQLL